MDSNNPTDSLPEAWDIDARIRNSSGRTKVNSIKNTIVTVTLLAVGYGTYVVLSEPVPPGVAQQGTEAVWDAATGEVASLDPEVTVELPPAAGAEGPSIPPPSELLATSEGQTGPDAAAASAALQAPDPLSVPADNLKAPLDRSLHTRPRRHGAAAAAWPVDLAPPSGANRPAEPAGGNPSQPPAADTGGGYYARQADPQPPAGYPQTSTPESPVASPNSAAAASAGSAGHPGFEETWKAVQTNLQNGQLADALFTLTVWYKSPRSAANRRNGASNCSINWPARSSTRAKVSWKTPMWSRSADVGHNRPAVQRAPGISGTHQRHWTAQPTDSGRIAQGFAGTVCAEISRSRNELTLFLGRYYAGRFPVRLGPELPAGDNLYEVIAKENGKEFFDRRTGDRISLDDPRNPYGDRWIGLRGEQITAAHNVGLHVDNGSTDLGCIALGRVDADDLSAILSQGSRVAVKP